MGDAVVEPSQAAVSNIPGKITSKYSNWKANEQ